MSLPTPPGTSHRDKENRTVLLGSTRVVWSQDNKYHSLSSPPRQRVISSASKELPTRSILKRPSYPSLPLLSEKPREDTPEPRDPLADLHYLDGPVSMIIAKEVSLRDLIEAYSRLAARLRTAVRENTDAECSWPLFQPLRKNVAAIVDSIIRDLGRAMIDPLADVALARTPLAESPTEKSSTVLPSPEKSPRKKRGMTEEQVKFARDLCTTTHSVIKLLGLVFTLPAVFRVFSGTIYLFLYAYSSLIIVLRPAARNDPDPRACNPAVQ
jgi:hypothetical protein